MSTKQKGYSPSNALLPLLGDYAKLLVYAPNSFNYTGSFIEAAMKQPFLRHQLTAVIKSFIKFSNSTQNIKEILCRDIINPHAIPHLNLYLDYENQKWSFLPNEATNEGNYILIQDSLFLLAIRLNQKSNRIEVYIYKK